MTLKQSRWRSSRCRALVLGVAFSVAAVLFEYGCGGTVQSDGGNLAKSLAGSRGIGGAVGTGGVPGGDGFGGCQPMYLPCHDCGDGWVDADEECDDGNPNSGDGCNRVCQVESNWECPNGSDCNRLSYCGDGLAGPGEACDDGTVIASNGDGCAADCQSIEPGWYCPIAGEPCSRIGSTLEPLGAGTSCSGSACPAACGNGVVDEGEECDLGLELNRGDYGSCASNCRLGPRCGDGEVNSSIEQCDLGPDNVARYGDIEPSCTPICTIAPFCGDGIANPEFGEQCDLGELNGGLEEPCGRTCLVVDMPCVVPCF